MTLDQFRVITEKIIKLSKNLGNPEIEFYHPSKNIKLNIDDCLFYENISDVHYSLNENKLRIELEQSIETQ